RQRSNVLLPEPLRPISTTTSPRSTEKEMSLRTSSGPKLFLTDVTSTTDMQPPLERPGQERDGKAQREIDYRCHPKNLERLKGYVIDELRGSGQISKADQGRQRRVLHDLDHEPDGRRESDADGLGNDDIIELLEPVQSD